MFTSQQTISGISYVGCDSCVYVILMLSWWLDPPIGGLDQWGGEAVVLSGLLVYWPADPHAFHRGLSGEPRQPPVRPSQIGSAVQNCWRGLGFSQKYIWQFCFCVHQVSGGVLAFAAEALRNLPAVRLQLWHSLDNHVRELHPPLLFMFFSGMFNSELIW